MLLVVALTDLFWTPGWQSTLGHLPKDSSGGGCRHSDEYHSVQVALLKSELTELLSDLNSLLLHSYLLESGCVQKLFRVRRGLVFGVILKLWSFGCGIDLHSLVYSWVLGVFDVALLHSIGSVWMHPSLGDKGHLRVDVASLVRAEPEKCFREADTRQVRSHRKNFEEAGMSKDRPSPESPAPSWRSSIRR
ncbi:hypothetical protein Tco_1401785 [Tanacetum coccineum]